MINFQTPNDKRLPCAMTENDLTSRLILVHKGRGEGQGYQARMFCSKGGGIHSSKDVFGTWPLPRLNEIKRH
jgi:hypothetical protein